MNELETKQQINQHQNLNGLNDTDQNLHQFNLDLQIKKLI